MYNREKNNEVEGVSPPKARALTVPCRKVIKLTYVLLTY